MYSHYKWLDMWEECTTLEEMVKKTGCKDGHSLIVAILTDWTADRTRAAEDTASWLAEYSASHPNSDCARRFASAVTTMLAIY